MLRFITRSVKKKSNQGDDESSKQEGEEEDKMTMTSKKKRKMDSTTPPPNKKSKSGSSKSKSGINHMSQYVIDAGQSDFDGMTTCITCGMIFTKGISEDESHHDKFHLLFLKQESKSEDADEDFPSPTSKSSTKSTRKKILTPSNRNSSKKRGEGIKGTRNIFAANSLLDNDSSSKVVTPKSATRGTPSSSKSSNHMLTILSSQLKSWKWNLLDDQNEDQKERVLALTQLAPPRSSANCSPGDDKLSARIIAYDSSLLNVNKKVAHVLDKLFGKLVQSIDGQSEDDTCNYSLSESREQLIGLINGRGKEEEEVILPPTIYLVMVVRIPAKEQSSNKQDTPTSSTPRGPKRKTFADYVIGLLSADSITRAERILSLDPLTCSTNQNHAARVGITRIWTHSLFRRNHVATGLVNTLRLNFDSLIGAKAVSFGDGAKKLVPIDQVALSDPSDHGLGFARKYFARDDILVFNPFSRQAYVVGEGESSKGEGINKGKEEEEKSNED